MQMQLKLLIAYPEVVTLIQVWLTKMCWEQQHCVTRLLSTERCVPGPWWDVCARANHVELHIQSMWNTPLCIRAGESMGCRNYEIQISWKLLGCPFSKAPFTLHSLSRNTDTCWYGCVSGLRCVLVQLWLDLNFSDFLLSSYHSRPQADSETDHTVMFHWTTSPFTHSLQTNSIGSQRCHQLKQLSLFHRVSLISEYFYMAFTSHHFSTVKSERFSALGQGNQIHQTVLLQWHTVTSTPFCIQTMCLLSSHPTLFTSSTWGFYGQNYCLLFGLWY